jgi:hypothetical protein
MERMGFICDANKPTVEEYDEFEKNVTAALSGALTPNCRELWRGRSSHVLHDKCEVSGSTAAARPLVDGVQDLLETQKDFVNPERLGRKPKARPGRLYG